MNFRNAHFLKSASHIDQLPEDSGSEVAFIGRSNAGKSSTLNCLTDQKRLARTSKTPGRTQLINVFSLDDLHRLIDLPGYGYAKAPGRVQKIWENMVQTYLQQRQCLKGLLLIVDSRHPLKPLDLHMARWTIDSELPLIILLNKADKLSKNQAKQQQFAIEKQLKEAHLWPNPKLELLLFSAEKSLGKLALGQRLETWMQTSEG